MPYIKTKDPPFVKMRRLILGYGLNANQLAPILGVTDKTARKRLENPELFTLRDIDLICRSAHIPMEELRAAVTR